MNKRDGVQPCLPAIDPPPPDAEKIRERARAALAKKRDRARVKALRLSLELEEEWRQTQRRLAEEAALLARLRSDPRIDALMEYRRAGKPVTDAVAEVERRFSARVPRQEAAQRDRSSSTR